MAKNIVLWVIIAVVLMTVFNSFTAPKTGAPQISYSKFLEEVDRKNVASVTIFKDGRIDGAMTSGSRFATESPNDPGLVGDLLKAGVEIRAKPPEQPSILWQILINWFPLFILIGLWIF
ncbi:MAG: ATP-dependent metallopeptidase FtsH/Yme1/Tma family protein, partial [Sedimenticolaceae bacterium]